MRTFREMQSAMRWWWMWIFVLGLLGLGAWGFIEQIILGQPWGTNPAPDWAMYALVLFFLAVCWFLVSIRLETRIDEIGVRYRLFPFHRKFRSHTWGHIDAALVRQYKPFAEYGGWGLRGGFNSGSAYSIKGNMGLQLIMKNGKRILIGTQSPTRLGEFLEAIEEKKAA